MENIYLQKQGQKTLKDIIKEGKMEKKYCSVVNHYIFKPLNFQTRN